MTKEKLTDYEGKLLCKTCGHYVSKHGIFHKSVFEDYSITKCKVCEWIDRHGGIPKYKNITDSQMIEVLHYIIYVNEGSLNEVADMCGISIEEVVELWDILRVGKKKIYIKVKCANCSNEVCVVPSVFKKNENIFCGRECYHAYRAAHLPKGEDSPFYNRIETKCANCGNPIKVIPFSYNATNADNEHNNFCSHKCYWEFRSKHYVGEKSNFYNYSPTERQIQKTVEMVLTRKKDDNRLNSGIQLKVNTFLDDLKIGFEREHIINYYSIDNYLIDSGLMIEVMGDYWHSNPTRYNENKYMLNQTQLKDIRKDKAKHTYIQKYHNVEILYLWETDINKNPELCIKLIQKYLSNNGVLDNYHSFNWHLDGENIKLNSSIIIPYQDKSVDEYKNLVKA